MPLSISPATLSSSLTLLGVGHRAWFWLCAGAPDTAPPLLLQPLSLSRSTADLQTVVAQLGPIRRRPVVGLASIGADGRLTLGGTGLTMDMLRHLAAWAAAHLDDHPHLARLRGTTLVDLDADGTVRARHQDPALWADFPEVVVAGTLAETARNLGRMKPGRSYWFWATAEGPGGGPHLAIGSASRDPQGRAFAESLAPLQASSGTYGVIRQTPSGRMVLSTSHDPQPLQALLPALSAQLSALEGAVLVQSAAGTVLQILKPPAPDA